jgi:hypothetical protein
MGLPDNFKGRKPWKESRYVLGWKEACNEYQLMDIWRNSTPMPINILGS